MVKRKSSTTQFPDWVFESAHRWAVLEKQVIAIVANLDIETDETLKQLDSLYAQLASEYTAEDWQLMVTSLTHDIANRCQTIDDHLAHQFANGV